MQRLILWDIDGTLVTCGPWGRRALEEGAAEAAGLAEVPVVAMGGKTDPQIVTEILAGAGFDPDAVATLVPVALAVAEARLAAWRPRLVADGRAHPGVRALLERLAAQPDVHQTLLTGNVEPNAFVKVDTFGLAGFFDFAIGAYGSDHAERDRLVPVALARAEAIRGARYEAADAWIIGDTANDLRCALAGGARCLLVRTGKEPLDAATEADADAVLDDLSDTDKALELLLGP